MMDEKRYVLIPVAEVTETMREHTIPYGVHHVQTLVTISGIQYEILKWRGDKPAELWSEFPVFSNTEMASYITTYATLESPPTP